MKRCAACAARRKQIAARLAAVAARLAQKTLSKSKDKKNGA